MANLFNFLGYRAFRSADEIKIHVINYIKYRPNLSESIDEATSFDPTDSHERIGFSRPIAVDDLRTLLLFRTQLQRTWLVATEKRIYCLLDDIEKDSDHEMVRWVADKSYLSNAIDSVTIRTKSDKTGVVDIGNKHRGWLYSKSLFVDESDLKNQILSMAE